ncbi:MAG: sigma-70 family RNA polymerase sigma factor [Labilithrix sp.]|nr:sigma-70 family RNA polymerase sigma factor [Labilithrix sp.]MCW5832999.1 sigma-70 family RNA polymerase sigma factor [Labilithrix sp.]
MLSRGLSASEVSDVYHRYGALLERRCRLLMRDHALGEDALQELLAALLRRGQPLREAASPYRWLCRAADRTCLDLLRRGKRVREALSSDGLESLDPLGPAPGVDAEARLAALESLALLDDEQQTLAIMLFVDGMSQGDAAAELGVSRVTVNKRTQRIRSQLGLSSHASTEAPS